MLFNSYPFIFLLLPVSVAGYFLAARQSKLLAILWLVVVSIFFYAWWRPENLPLFLGSILFNFFAARFLSVAQAASQRRIGFCVSVTANLALLGYFKYGGFVVQNLNWLTGSHFTAPNVVLPLGISFFTFTQIAYLADIHRQGRTSHPLPAYALFVSFFPHLLAGPILHHEEMLPQFNDEENRIPRYAHLWRGACLFGVGLCKKVLIADVLVPFVRFGFDSSAAPTFLEAWLATLAYCFQIYFDFSGYTDMAIGAAFLMNIRLPFNFNSPYHALDIQAFWRRWHITLGRFFRDYIYIPLGGSRCAGRRTAANLFGVALLSGLWHGAAWSYVAWGALHGLAMVVFYYWKRLGLKLAAPLAWALTFCFINLTWIMFRAPDWARAHAIFQGLIGGNGIVLFAQLQPILGWAKHFGVQFKSLAMLDVDKLVVYLAVAAFIVFWPRNSNDLLDETRPVGLWKIAAIAALSAFSILHLGRLSEFIYFNF